MGEDEDNGFSSSQSRREVSSPMEHRPKCKETYSTTQTPSSCGLRAEPKDGHINNLQLQVTHMKL